MDHKVRITPEAEADLRSIGDYIARQAPDTAGRFIRSLRAQIATLRTFPTRHGIAPEAELAGVELRQMIFGMYRVLYTCDAETVTVHGVRHGARRPLQPEELPGQS
jgi:toxin ParE1/3/4